MIAIDALAVITVAAFVVIIAATVVVTIGVHQEERRKTFTRRIAPTATAEVARAILGQHVVVSRRERVPQRPAEPVPRYETAASRSKAA